VPGVAVHAVDTAHFEITNSTDRDYYFKAIAWSTDDNLACGRGVNGHDVFNGRISAGMTTQGVGGSTPEVPMTVAIWPEPCGDGCTEPSVGDFVIPISTVEPPRPGAT